MTRPEFERRVLDALQRIPGGRDLASRFLTATPGFTRFVIGRNEQAAEVAALLKLDGLVDDFAQGGEIWNGLKVIASSQLPNNAVILNCSTSISPIDVSKKMGALPITGLLSIHELIHAAGGSLKWPRFVMDQRRDYREHPGEWGDLFERLEDEASKQTLLDVLMYRLTAEADYMSGYPVRLKEQYFEEFLALGREVFIDAGGFDGDTSEEFCRRYPDYQKVFLFEPSASNMATARSRLKGLHDIEFMQEGLSDSDGELSFDPDLGSASSVSSTSGTRIKVTTLDQAVKQPVSFIKMDLEGWELKALSGCRTHILEDKPKLAISVYHAARDFREIPGFILSLNPDYRVFLRHYTQGWSETVMFFV
jgi:FkbM family methyltransferase